MGEDAKLGGSSIEWRTDADNSTVLVTETTTWL